MIILDIDQDYFFLPVISKKIIESPVEREKRMYQAKSQPKDIIDKFSIHNFKGTIISDKDHDHVYYCLKKNNIQNATLIHVDAHDDVEHGKLKEINLGNWITHSVLDGLINKNIIWINQQDTGPHTKKVTHNNMDYFLHISQLKDFNFNNKIDIIFYTKSEEFCPPNDKEKEFYNLINLRC